MEQGVRNMPADAALDEAVRQGFQLVSHRPERILVHRHGKCLAIRPHPDGSLVTIVAKPWVTLGVHPLSTDEVLAAAEAEGFRMVWVTPERTVFQRGLRCLAVEPHSDGAVVKRAVGPRQIAVGALAVAGAAVVLAQVL